VIRSSSLDGPVERVHARRIDDVAHLGADERASLGDGDGGARIVRHRYVAPGEAAEDDALADVRLADERYTQRPRAQLQRL
jgi:hypothetical protein